MFIYFFTSSLMKATRNIFSQKCCYDLNDIKIRPVSWKVRVYFVRMRVNVILEAIFKNFTSHINTYVWCVCVCVWLSVEAFEVFVIETSFLACWQYLGQVWGSRWLNQGQGHVLENAYFCYMGISLTCFYLSQVKAIPRSRSSQAQGFWSAFGAKSLLCSGRNFKRSRVLRQM